MTQTIENNNAASVAVSSCNCTVDYRYNEKNILVSYKKIPCEDHKPMTEDEKTNIRNIEDALIVALKAIFKKNQQEFASMFVLKIKEDRIHFEFLDGRILYIDYSPRKLIMSMADDLYQKIIMPPDFTV